MDAEYKAIPFSLKEFVSMKVLFYSAFGAEISYPTFLKRFDTFSLGNEVIGYIAIHRQSNTPAAYYGVFPVKLLMNNEIVLAAQSGDTMTHEKHRKKGLFLWLAKMTFEKCAENGIAFVFGIPNCNSYTGFVKHLNWLHVDNINSYDLKLKVKTIPFPKLALKFGLFQSYVRIAKGLLRRHIVKPVEQFQNPLNTYDRVFRDTYYLQYKQAENKIFIKVNEVIVWIKFSDVLWIGDFDNYGKVDKTTITKLGRIAAFLGYNTIRFNFNEGLPQPSFLQFFKKAAQEPSCFFYINKKLQDTNLVLTAADFDTW